VVATGDMLTSVFGGFATFAIIGYMANELLLPINKVATHGNIYYADVYLLIKLQACRSPLFRAHTNLTFVCLYQRP